MTMPDDSRKNERGIALIIVLLVVTLLTILVVEFTYTVQVESHISRNSLNSLQATYLARSGINIAAAALLMDEDDPANVDPAAEGDGWRSFIDQGCIRVLKNEDWLPPNWDLCVRIVDESGKINVNFTRPPPTRPNPNAPQECVPSNQATLNYCWLDALGRLMAQYGIDQDGVQELADYWTTGVPAAQVGQVTQPLAPEFGSLEDVAAAFPPLRDRTTLDNVRDFVTALPATSQQRQVNINTASQQVLTAILNDEGVASDIVTRRQTEPFTNAGEALQNLDSSNQIARRMFNTRSNVFRIEAVGIVNGVGKTVRALVQRDRAGGGANAGRGPVAGQANTGNGQVSWYLTYLDWQKENGIKAAREADAEREGLEGNGNSAKDGG